MDDEIRDYEIFKECSDILHSFKNELVKENRFFLNNSNLISYISKLLNYSTTIKESGFKLFRSRIYNKQNTNLYSYDRRYSLSEMGAPPIGIATSGRANPDGISYLYLASDPKTAIAEVRPWKNANISVATYEVVESIKLFDAIKYFINNHSKETYDDPYLFYFSLLLDMEFSTPVNPNCKNDYLPTQYIAEYIKHEGYDGILYRSSLGKGYNVVLFDSLKVKGIEPVEMYEIKDVNYSSERKESQLEMLSRVLQQQNNKLA